ncbi:uncharacterized protein LOC143849831 isoform X4 [Tasmannia lanceolata]|uniref:uncharacterized protein LOC143849831 isoform X4 n=1 Tax=Tasmannia lanceolata TaxID=3420 RepID=UPI0040647839
MSGLCLSSLILIQWRLMLMKRWRTSLEEVSYTWSFQATSLKMTRHQKRKIDETHVKSIEGLMSGLCLSSLILIQWRLMLMKRWRTSLEEVSYTWSFQATSLKMMRHQKRKIDETHVKSLEGLMSGLCLSSLILIQWRLILMKRWRTSSEEVSYTWCFQATSLKMTRRQKRKIDETHVKSLEGLMSGLCLSSLILIQWRLILMKRWRTSLEEVSYTWCFQATSLKMTRHQKRKIDETHVKSLEGLMSGLCLSSLILIQWRLILMKRWRTSLEEVSYTWSFQATSLKMTRHQKHKIDETHVKSIEGLMSGLCLSSLILIQWRLMLMKRWRTSLEEVSYTWSFQATSLKMMRHQKRKIDETHVKSIEGLMSGLCLSSLILIQWRLMLMKRWRTSLEEVSYTWSFQATSLKMTRHQKRKIDETHVKSLEGLRSGLCLSSLILIQWRLILMKRWRTSLDEVSYTWSFQATSLKMMRHQKRKIDETHVKSLEGLMSGLCLSSLILIQWRLILMKRWRTRQQA